MIVTNAGGVPVKTWVGDLSEVEADAIEQAYKVSRLPFIYKHVSLMPDVHLGKGACVGSVIAYKSAVVPALVGVDIGCGMVAARLNINASKLPDSLKKIRLLIESVVPVGNGTVGQHKYNKNLGKVLDINDLSMAPDKFAYQRAHNQIGTLGGGNHFIELCLDQNDDVWIMLHSGSRNIGKTMADMHINKAKGLMKQMFIRLEDPDLAYFAKGTEEYQNYLNDVMWCQEYAKHNRLVMFDQVLWALKKNLPNISVEGSVTSCHHNYISIENHFGENVIITRKGAIRAREGDLGIIPGSMGTKSYIVKGLGNEQSFCSCSHGAGRAMSRSKAKKLFTLEDLKNQTAGVECKKDHSIIDEIPGAYKDIDKVMDNQKDLVEVLYTLKQVMCIKG